ncbi:MAG: glucokinase [Pseudomonadota bacterium]
MKPILLGDIGGTNARFAFLAEDGLSRLEAMRVADYPSAVHAVETFLARHGGKQAIASMALAVAGPVEGNRCALTNSPWVVDGAELRRKFGVASVRVINDFAAIAWSLPQLGPPDLFALGDGRAEPNAPMLVLGPGTGLGLACFVPGTGGGTVIATEGGHATLPSTNAREDAIIQHLRERFGHVSIERALSGGGLVNLYEATATIDRISTPPRSAEEITRAALDGTCPVGRAALDLFCALLGAVAGDLALTFGARGGVYIAGGIVPRFPDYLSRTEFRRRFEAKGRFRTYLEAIPAAVILRPDAAFAGLKSLMASAT